MNIVINIDKNYVGIASVMLYSLLENNKTPTDIYIFNDDLRKEDIERINNSLLEFNNYNLIDIKINSTMFPVDTSTLTKRWGKAVFYRLLVSEFLPETVDRALYMDTDIIVDGEIINLYNIDLKNNYIAACLDTEVSDLFDNSRIGIDNANIYFNSGVVLFDIQRIRRDNILDISNINTVINNMGDNLLFPDQDLLNVIFVGKTLVLEYRKYNFLCARSRYSSRLLRMYGRKAVIFHYGGEQWHRPWNYFYVGKFAKLFWKYALKTPYGESIKTRRYVNWILKPFFVCWFDIRLILIKVRSKLGWG